MKHLGDPTMTINHQELRNKTTCLAPPPSQHNLHRAISQNSSNPLTYNRQTLTHIKIKRHINYSFFITISYQFFIRFSFLENHHLLPFIPHFHLEFFQRTRSNNFLILEYLKNWNLRFLKYSKNHTTLAMNHMYVSF
jgi:hypothetical protein